MGSDPSFNFIKGAWQVGKTTILHYLKSELCATLRMNAETVNRYLDILEGTFVFTLVPPWFSNPRKEVSKMPKVYVDDPGILLASDARAPARVNYDLLDGHSVENAVYASLASPTRTPAGA